MYREPPPYHTFILRIWLERGEQPQWRFVIENPETGERLQFDSPDGMLAALRTDVLQFAMS